MPEVIVAAEWFDGERRRREPATFEIADGRITAITPGDHGAALAAGGCDVARTPFLMPTLVDAHVHLFLHGHPTDPAARAAHLKLPVEQLAAAARESARQALARGVTLVRDAGDRHGINHRVRAEAAAHASGMARVRSAGVAIKRPRRYGAFMGADAADASGIRSLVQALARDSDEIKLLLTGIIDFDAGAVTDQPQFDLDAARLVVDTAHACGRPVFAHCSGTLGLEVAVEAGVDCIEHGFFMTRGHLARMRDRGLAWTPTFCPVHFQWARPDAAGWSPATVGKLRRILEDHAEHLRLAHALGVTVLVGTDAGSMGVPHGDAVFDEIDRFLEAGLPMEAVLGAATSVPRRHFGAAHPALCVGAPCELLLLAESPFERASALRGPAAVRSAAFAAAAPVQ